MKRIIIVVISASLLGGCSSENKKEPVEAKSTITKYQTAIVEKAGVATQIKLPAQLAAFEEVSIFPKVNGYVKNVNVDIGSRVSKGQLLMVLEAPELEEAAAQAKEKYARTKADLAIGKEHYQRLLEASQTKGAISPLDLSTTRSKMESDSALSNAERSNWQMQVTMQAYLKVTAPFSGVITERNVHPGALVSAETKQAKPMLELKQVDHLRLEVDVPENISGTIKNKDTITFYTSAFPGKKMTGLISRRSMNVNTQFRSERMEIDVNNHDGALSPGMYADVILDSKGNRNAWSVPTASVVTSTERKYVIAVVNGKTVKIDVSTGNQTAGKIEVFGNLTAGEKIIVNANDEIKENQTVE